MKKSTFAILLAFIGFIAQAQIPNGYYNNAANKTGDDLKIALHNIIKNHHQVSYSGLLDAFAYTDCKANGKIWDIYSNYEFNLSGTCGSYKKEGDCWNREHTWPQSWFNEQSIPRSDLFHVYPTDGYVNNRRSSYPYGEVNHPTYTSGNGSKLGPCVTAGYSGTVFEPIDEYKGDIARSYFYMSVRYYSEDSGWDNTDMTLKSVIKPWAMTMLLRWSDEDPVSDKEIARNNAVYGYQNNRNPFIDHPEYARMIWDSEWQAGTDHNITCATSSHGSVSAPETAMEGATVAITATPDPGYMVSSYSVYKTGSPSTTVTVSSNGTFIMPAYDVTVSATFVVNNTYYKIALGTVSHGSISTTGNVSSAKSGTTINLTATPNSNYSLYSWYVYKTGDMNTTVNVADPHNTSTSFVMPAFDVTVMATFSPGSSGDGDYVKVTSAPSDWSGEYILVYENTATQGYVWTGVDATNCYDSKTISSNTIAYDNNLVTITIAPMSGGYSVRVNGGTNAGKYIYGSSNDNKVNFGTSAALNTFSYESNSVKMTSNNSVMRFNNTSGNLRFRYFKSSTYSSQQPIQLYKKTSAPIPTPTHNIQFNKNDGSGTTTSQTVNEYEATALQANMFTRTGYVFDGWNTANDGSGDNYADGATVTLLDDLTLYAQWDQLYTITLANVTNGSISANVTEALEETTITLTANPADGYEFEYWTVTDELNNTIEVTENQFEMPASNVTVSATFVPQSTPSVTQYVKVTETPSDWSGEYLIVCEANNVAFNGTIDNYWGKCSGVTITENTIESNTITDSYVVTVTGSNADGYQFLLPSGKYMSWTSKNFTENTTAQNYSISLSSGNVSIMTGTYMLQYNHNSGSGGLRSYTSDQTAIQLYKKVSGTTPDPETPFEVSYHLVTSTDQLVAGRTYLIVNESAGKALSKTQNSNNRAAAAVSISDHTISTLGDACELTLGGQSGHWTLYDATNNSGYLYAASSSSNILNTQATNDANGQWSISIASSGDATITAKGTNTRKLLRYNSSNNPPIFSCYASGQTAVQLFIRSEEIPHTSSETVANIFSFDKHVIKSGATLTVTGTATCNDSNNLIIEEGGQFIHHNAGVKATMKKSIQAYTQNESDGWYTIASPFTSFTLGEVTTDNYDLFAYDEDATLEWFNYKAHQDNFPANPGTGYLYAHNPATTLRMTGILNSGDYSEEISLSYASNNADIKGFNLLGNPTAHDITFSKTGNVSDGYYYLSNSATWVAEPGNTVPAGRGFLVKANAEGQSVTLNPQSKRGVNDVETVSTPCLQIDVDGERAFVKMDDGVSLPLLSFRGKTQRIYFNRNGMPYVILVKGDAETIHLNYQPNSQDRHNLSVSTNGLDLEYLHLIDRLTSADIDLLATPNYSFESGENDPASRFLLRFSPVDNEVEDDNFAYYQDGTIRLIGSYPDASLQVMDITGRIVSDNHLTPGVYILRLITPNNIRTQKIVIK